MRLRLHRIILVAAHGLKWKSLEVDHVDNDRTNYRLDNLSPVTRRENEALKHERRYRREQTETVTVEECDALPF